MAATGLFGRSAELERLLASTGGVQYDAEAMVDELLASAWPSGGASGPAARHAAFSQQTRAMDALHSVLEDAIARLKAHRVAVDARIAALEGESAGAGAVYHDALRSPEQLLGHICGQMEDLEERFSKVSAAAVLVGDKLTRLDGERARVLETDELMEALVALNETASDATSSSRLVRTLRDPTQLHEAARVMKRIRGFSSELTSPALTRAVAEIERLSQSIESQLLDAFSDAQERARLDEMRACAASLIEFNDKDKVADRFVWNVIKDRLAGRNAGGDPLVDLESLCETIRSVCRDQFAVIESVFPTNATGAVRELLVERLFNDPVFGVFASLDQVLSASAAAALQHADVPTSPSASTSARRSQAGEEYVELLCGAYKRTCALATAIEQIDVHKERGEEDPSDNQSGDSNVDRAGEKERMQTFLSLQLHSLFGAHRPKYFRTELELLQLSCRDVVAGVRFPQQLTARQKAAAVKAGKNAASSSSSSTSVPPSVSSTQLVSTASTTSVEGGAVGVGGAVSLVEWSQLYFESLKAIAEDTDAPDRFLSALKTAIDRCNVVLESESELRGELLTKLFAVFINGYGDEYVGKIAALGNDLLQDPYTSPEAARQFFQVLEMVLRRIDLLDEAFESVLVPAQSESPTQLTICYESKRKQLDKLETLVSRGLVLVFTVVDKDVAALLTAQQEKSDFVGSEANLSLASSRACRRVSEFLQPLLSASCAVLVDENRERFLAVSAAHFKDVYLQHILRFKFDADGACMLLRDVSAFRGVFRKAAARSHALQAVDDAFDVLHEVANAFALPPENVGGFVRDGKLAALGRSTLLELVKRRVDYRANADKITLS